MIVISLFLPISTEFFLENSWPDNFFWKVVVEIVTWSTFKTGSNRFRSFTPDIRFRTGTLDLQSFVHHKKPQLDPGRGRVSPKSSSKIEIDTLHPPRYATVKKRLRVITRLNYELFYLQIDKKGKRMRYTVVWKISITYTVLYPVLV